MRKKADKPYWEMTSEELAQATKEFDSPSYHPRALPLRKQDKAQLRRAKRRGRPTVGEGAEKVRISLERSLLRATDSWAEEHQVSRSQAIAVALQSLVHGMA